MFIQAEYRPLVSSIDVVVPEPVGGEEMATQVDDMTVRILRSDGMEVDARVEWNAPTSERPEGDLRRC